MPGTCIGGFRSNIATSPRSGVSCLRVLSNKSRLPRRHVYITSITRPPSASGIQPPSWIFSILAPRKMRSISRNGAINAPAAHGDHFQLFQMTMKAIMAVTTIVPVTAIP